MNTAAQNPPVRQVAAGLGFTEGPVWTLDGRLVITSISRGLLYEVPTDGSGAQVLAQTGGGPNGLAQDADGSFWVAQNGGVIISSRSPRPVAPGIQRLREGQVDDVLVESFDAPNDLALGPDGRLWFTDPRAPGDEAPGRVCAYDPRSGHHEVVASGLSYPNGLAFTSDGAHLLVADTDRRCVVRFPVGSGALGDPEAFAELPVGAPDGMAIDDRGRLYVAATDADAVVVFEPDGSLHRVLDLGGPSMATNVCFGGDGMATLFVTAAKGGRVLAVEGNFPGARPAAWR